MPRSELLGRLRQATADAHARLEAELDLLAQPLDRERFVHALCRFHGFHRTWEPAAAEALGAGSFLEPRRRLHLIEADLAALGLSREAIGRLPACAEAGRRESPARALGALYVMEGSTLGGQVIARALKDAAWAPPGGIRYFDPYGARTGEMWRTLQTFLDVRGAGEAEAEIVAAAVDTFERLRRWVAADVAATV